MQSCEIIVASLWTENLLYSASDGVIVRYVLGYAVSQVPDLETTVTPDNVPAFTFPPDVIVGLAARVNGYHPVSGTEIVPDAAVRDVAAIAHLLLTTTIADPFMHKHRKLPYEASNVYVTPAFR